MPLHDMPVEQRIGFHRPLDVDQITDLQRPQVAAQQRLLHGRHGVGVLREVHNCQTYAVMCYALVDFQLLAEIRPEREILVLTVRADRNHFRRTFHDA